MRFEVNEGRNVLRVVKGVMRCGALGCAVKIDLYEGVDIQTELYRIETVAMGAPARRSLNVSAITWLRSTAVLAWLVTMRYKCVMN